MKTLNNIPMVTAGQCSWYKQEASAIEQQRDKLLTALKSITDESVCLKADIVANARAIIAEIEATK